MRKMPPCFGACAKAGANATPAINSAADRAGPSVRCMAVLPSWPRVAVRRPGLALVFVRGRLVPRTRSSHNLAARALANFGFESGTRNHSFASVLRFGGSLRRKRHDRAKFGIG